MCWFAMGVRAGWGVRRLIRKKYAKVSGWAEEKISGNERVTAEIRRNEKKSQKVEKKYAQPIFFFFFFFFFFGSGVGWQKEAGGL
jgi:hypothetical protein